MMDAWEVLRASKDLLCDFGWVRPAVGTFVFLPAKGGRQVISVG